MASRGKLGKDVNLKSKDSKKKSPPAFVPLDGLSQSAKDRRMNNRTVKPPRNLNLVEGDPGDKIEVKRRSRQHTAFPNEHLLSSKIKEVNGMDHSNHSIEQYYRNHNSRSTSPDVSENSTISSCKTNESIHCDDSQEEACISTLNCSTGVESSNPGSDSNIDSDKVDDAMRNSRYSKNAAIMGMLKNHYISLGDLTLDEKEKRNFCSEDDGLDIQEIVGDKSCEDNAKKIPEHPSLVPHPDDPEFFTNPLLAYGKLDDGEIDFSLPRHGKKTSMTPREYFIKEGMDDERFAFQKPPAKPKLDIIIPKIIPSCSSRNQTYPNREASNSYASSRNDEDVGFRMNREDFPTLRT